MVRLDIFADPICPWCYLGKTLLDQALAQRPDHPFVIEWHPFLLNPEMPPEGMDHLVYLAQHFGSAEAAGRADAQVVAAARAAGVDLDLSRVTRTPSTIDAHRLIYWAGVEGRQDALVDALFAAHFEEGRDISDPETLADLADGAALDAALMARLLRSDVDRDEIRSRDAAAREMGLTGAPAFIVNRVHAVPGVQPTELWLKVIDEIAGPGPAAARH
jgi:predicted DsbA family dithiol-disulfide isomerase